MNTRIYVVNDGADNLRLVRAASATQAVKHTTKHITAEVVEIERYGELLLAGVVVEEVERETVA
jgi:hypothetical protein